MKCITCEQECAWMYCDECFEKQRDSLIKATIADIGDLAKLVQELKARVAELEARAQ